MRPARSHRCHRIVVDVLGLCRGRIIVGGHRKPLSLCLARDMWAAKLFIKSLWKSAGGQLFVAAKSASSDSGFELGWLEDSAMQRECVWVSWPARVGCLVPAQLAAKVVAFAVPNAFSHCFSIVVFAACYHREVVGAWLLAAICGRGIVH